MHGYHQPAGSFPHPQSCGIAKKEPGPVLQALSLPVLQSLAQNTEVSGGLGSPRSVTTVFSPHSTALAGPGRPHWLLSVNENPQGWVGQASQGDSTQ